MGTHHGALKILDRELLHVMLVLLDFVRVLGRFLELEAESTSELKERVSSGRCGECARYSGMGTAN